MATVRCGGTHPPKPPAIELRCTSPCDREPGWPSPSPGAITSPGSAPLWRPRWRRGGLPYRPENSRAPEIAPHFDSGEQAMRRGNRLAGLLARGLRSESAACSTAEAVAPASRAFGSLAKGPALAGERAVGVGRAIELRSSLPSSRWAPALRPAPPPARSGGLPSHIGDAVRSGERPDWLCCCRCRRRRRPPPPPHPTLPLLRAWHPACRLLAAGRQAWAAAAQPAALGRHAPHLRAGPEAQRPVRRALHAACRRRRRLEALRRTRQRALRLTARSPAARPAQPHPGCTAVRARARPLPQPPRRPPAGCAPGPHPPAQL